MAFNNNCITVVDSHQTYVLPHDAWTKATNIRIRQFQYAKTFDSTVLKASSRLIIIVLIGTMAALRASGGYCDQVITIALPTKRVPVPTSTGG